MQSKKLMSTLYSAIRMMSLLLFLIAFLTHIFPFLLLSFYLSFSVFFTFSLLHSFTFPLLHSFFLSSPLFLLFSLYLFISFYCCRLPNYSFPTNALLNIVLLLLDLMSYSEAITLFHGFNLGNLLQRQS
jgi:hypothetical protein